MPGAVAATTKTNCLSVVDPMASANCTVKVLVSAVVGVPLKTPLVASKSPGTEPEVMLHEYGVEPPVAVNVFV